MSKQKKYMMTRVNQNPIRYRITALRDIPKYGIQAFAMGGIIESEENLSQEGDGWIDDGSTVLGSSQVVDGYVGGKSMLLGNVIVVNGHIQDTIVDGDIVINGDIQIENSYLLSNGRYTSSGSIKKSHLRNCFVTSPFTIHYTTIEAKKHFYGYRKIDMFSVMLETETNFVQGELNLKHVVMEASKLYVNESLTMEHVQVQLDKSFRVEDEDLEDGFETVIMGEENASLLIEGELFSIHNSTIKGDSELVGSIRVEDSVIEGMNSIQMKNGLISNSNIHECVTIKQTTAARRTIINQTLHSDMLVNCDFDVD